MLPKINILCLLVKRRVAVREESSSEDQNEDIPRAKRSESGNGGPVKDDYKDLTTTDPGKGTNRGRNPGATPYSGHRLGPYTAFCSPTGPPPLTGIWEGGFNPAPPNKWWQRSFATRATNRRRYASPRGR